MPGEWVSFDLNEWGPKKTLPSHIGLKAEMPARADQYCGPFSYDGALYAVLIEPRPVSRLQVWKSEDDGVMWRSLDSGNAPHVFAGLFALGGVRPDVRVFQAQASGNILHIVYVNRNFQGINVPHLHAITFNMDTGLWGTPIPSTIDPSVGASNPYFQFVVRSNGEYVVHTYGGTETVMGVAYARSGYCRMTGSAWVAVTQIPSPGSQFAIHGYACVLGQDDRVHFFTQGGVGFDIDIFHRSMTSANVLNTYQTLAADGYGVYLGIPITYTDELGDLYVLQSATRIYPGTLTVFRGLAVDDPVWTSTLIDGQVPYWGDSPASCFTVNGVDIGKPEVFMLYIDSDTQQIAYTRDEGTDTWQSQEIWREVTADRLNVGTNQLDEIGVLYRPTASPSGGVVYDLFRTPYPVMTPYGHVLEPI